MNQRLRRSSDKKLGRLTWLVIGLLVLAFLLPRLFSMVGMVVLYPVQATTQWFANTSALVPALWRDKLTLQNELLTREAELAAVADTSLSVTRLQAENDRLRTLLGASTSPRIAAGVITRPSALPFDVLQIDQGTQAGVTVGAPVYGNQEEVIGLVSRVYPRTALVTLFSTPGIVSTAYVSESNILAQVEGMGGGVHRVSIAQGIPIQLDSLVCLPGIQPGVLGRIVAIESEPTQPQQFAYVVSSVPLEQLRYVAVGSTNDMQTDKFIVEAYIQEINNALTLPPITLATTTATSTATSTATTSAVSTQMP